MAMVQCVYCTNLYLSQSYWRFKDNLSYVWMVQPNLCVIFFMLYIVCLYHCIYVCYIFIKDQSID